MPDTSRRKQDYKNRNKTYTEVKNDLAKKKKVDEASKLTKWNKASTTMTKTATEIKKNVDQDKNATKSVKQDTSSPNKGRGLTQSEKAQIKKGATDSGLTVNKVGQNKGLPKKGWALQQQKKAGQTPQQVEEAKKEKRNSNNKRRLDDYSKDIQNRAISGQNGTGVLNGNGNNALDKVFNPTGKFISNAIDSTINNSAPGAVYTFATGKHLTDGAYNDNPYEEQRHQGL